MFKRVLVAIFLFSSCAYAQVYPLKQSSNNRYLVDANGTPVLLVGDTAHDMIGKLTPADIATYLADRQKNHFNAVNIYAPCGSYVQCNSNGSAQDGTLPFTSGSSPSNFDLSTPNNAYFTKVDNVINTAAANGITIMFDPIETGDFLTTLEANGTNKAYNYGVYLGNRYKGFPNIIWMHGEDFQSWSSNSSDNNLAAQVMAGIASVDFSHVQTIELDYPLSYSSQDSAARQYVGMDYAYTYYETYADVLTAYNTSPTIPVILGEANYEGGNDTGGLPGLAGAEVVRRQVYWTLLSGGAGHFYGNETVNHFNSGWQNNLDTASVYDVQYATNLFAAYKWWSLVPDQTHQIVTSGYGTSNSGNETLTTSNYATTAWITDGTLAIAYAPTTATLTVNLAKFANPVAAKWYDPGNGTFQSLGAPFTNSGTHNFVTPGTDSDGNKDWILVLDATTAGTHAGVSITTTSLPGGTVGTSYSSTMATTGGVTPLTWKITGLPAGLTSSGATISGTPTATATASVTITVTDSASPQTSASVTLTLAVGASGSQSSFTPIRIKAGTAYTDSQGNVWSTDTALCSGGTTDYSVSKAIANALPGSSDSALYQSERYNNSSCIFATPAGTYTLTVKDSENYWTAAGQRRFNITINGAVVASNVDLFALTGGQFKAIDLSYTFTTSGQTTVSFVNGSNDFAKYDAIQIVSAGSSPPPPPPPPPPSPSLSIHCSGSTCTLSPTNIPSGTTYSGTITTSDGASATFTGTF